MTINRVMFVIAAVIFLLASVGEWPHVVSDFEALALGLAFLAAGHAL